MDFTVILTHSIRFQLFTKQMLIEHLRNATRGFWCLGQWLKRERGNLPSWAYILRGDKCCRETIKLRAGEKVLEGWGVGSGEDVREGPSH